MNRDDDLFGEAIELPLAERAVFLDRACAGDAALRARLDALLAAHDAAENFLARSPVVRPADSVLPAEEKPGDVIGRYTLLKKIGEGGCGVVYLAEQTEPVRRRVALKVIKLGMDTRQVIARFEAERQALAMMDHPDIARVFDAGATATGRPFFVMEFVDGVPITRFCDEHSVSTAERLELFARVCLALQHAHQKGIVHRDIKPSNILVTLHDGVPTPKVIDFGIAKATQGRLTEHTLLTGLEQLIGTPAYMSPEQAELRDLDIDTRSDVYSLGVLLYELLTGQPPFDPKSLVRAGVDEIRRIIREVDPPRPSTRLSTLTDADRSTVAKLRRAAPAQLSTTLRGDLDWIVMRCLEKNRDRRYGTAHELADDVRRHLRREPVAARPPSAAYRAEKFIARNRLAVASAAAIAAALIVGTVVSVRQAIRATRAEHAAVAERDAANAARAAESLARADAQRRQGEAEDLLTFMVGDFRTGLEKIGHLDLLDVVGEKALAYFTALDPRDLTDTALARQAKALTQIGEIRMAEARYADADAAFKNAYQRASALAVRHPQSGDLLFDRAQAEYWIGFVALRRGDFPTEREWSTRYRDSALALLALEGKTLRAQGEVSYGYHNLAAMEFAHGDLAAARRGFETELVVLAEMLAAKPGDSEFLSRAADTASWLGSVADAEGHLTEAIDHFTESASRYDALIAQEPAVARWRFKVTDSLALAGEVLARTGRGATALANYTRARALLDALVEQDPKNKHWQNAALKIRLSLIPLQLAHGEAASIAPMLEETLQRLEALVKAEPSSSMFPNTLGIAWRLEAERRFMLGQTDAEDAVGRALELFSTLVKAARADDKVRGEFAQTHLLAGRIAAAHAKSEIARDHWQNLLTELAPRLPTSHDWRFLDPAAQALLLLGRPDDARPLIERLKHSEYHPIDSAAASLLDASRHVSPNQNP